MLNLGLDPVALLVSFTRVVNLFYSQLTLQIRLTGGELLDAKAVPVPGIVEHRKRKERNFLSKSNKKWNIKVKKSKMR